MQPKSVSEVEGARVEDGIAEPGAAQVGDFLGGVLLGFDDGYSAEDGAFFLGAASAFLLKLDLGALGYLSLEGSATGDLRWWGGGSPCGL